MPEAPPDPRDPSLMLERFRQEIDSRSCRLFAVACCRRIWNHLSNDLQSALEIAEKFAQGQTDDDTRIQTATSVTQTCGYVDGDSSATDRYHEFAREAVRASLYGDSDYPLIPTYYVTCAIAAAAAVVEVALAHAELAGHPSEEALQMASTEHQWQYDYLCQFLRKSINHE